MRQVIERKGRWWWERKMEGRRRGEGPVGQRNE